jgi:hypothetical protein
VQQIAQRQARQTARQSGQQELGRVGPSDLGRALAQHPQQRAFVQVARREVARRERHGNARQQGRQQRHQAQEAFATVEGLTQFGAARGQGLDARTAPLAVPQRGLKLCRQLAQRRPLRGLAAQRHAVADPAGRLHQLRGRQIAAVEHDARRKGQEARTAVGLLTDLRADAQPQLAHAEPVAQLQAQAVQYRRVDPHLPLGRPPCTLPFAAFVQPLQLTAQRVGVVHGLDGHQAGRAALCVAGAHHAWETGAVALSQTQALCPLAPARIGRPVGRHHQVTADQRRRVALEALFDAVTEQRHGADGGHGQHQTEHQQAQLAGPRIAPQSAQDLQTERRRRGSHARDRWRKERGIVVLGRKPCRKRWQNPRPLRV